MKFTDAVLLDGETRTTSDGWLVATARSVRTGIQLYAGSEVGRPDLSVVRVHRDASEVFAADSLQSFSHTSVTLDHPAGGVTPDNWKDEAVGEVSTAARIDGEWVQLPLVLKDRRAIEAVQGGKRELSAGYTCELDWTPGETADGQPFDASQRNIRINHLAIVDRARAGSKARIGDGAGSWGAAPITTSTNNIRSRPMTDNLRKVVLDGISIETTDQGAEAISKLQAQLSDANAAHAKADAEHIKAIAAKDADLAKKDAEIDDLKGKVMDDAAIDARVQARGDLIAAARAIHADVKTDGVSDADIRKAVVAAKLGDTAIKDKPQAYIDARFDILAEDAKGLDQTRQAIAGRVPVTGDAVAQVNDAWIKGVADLNAWRNQKEA